MAKPLICVKDSANSSVVLTILSPDTPTPYNFVSGAMPAPDMREEHATALENRGSVDVPAMKPASRVFVFDIFGEDEPAVRDSLRALRAALVPGNYFCVQGSPTDDELFCYIRRATVACGSYDKRKRDSGWMTEVAVAIITDPFWSDGASDYLDI